MIDGMIYVADFLLKSKDGEKREGIKANLYKNLILILQQMYTLYLLVYQTCIYNGKIYFIKKKTKEKFKNSFVRQSSTKFDKNGGGYREFYCKYYTKNYKLR